MKRVAKKKSVHPNRRNGTLIRVSDEFANALRDVTGFEKATVAEFCDAQHLPVVRKRYRESVLKEARRLEGGAK